MDFVKTMLCWKCKMRLVMFALLLCMMPVGVPGFVLSGNCPAPQPCHCTSNSISCNFKGLTSVPKFTSISSNIATQSDRFFIYLSGNKLTTIPGRVFENIHLKQNTEIILWLDVNHISSINADAFIGVENVISYINLNGNNLTTIPAALGTLNALHKLYVHGNPIKHLDGSTMSLIGRSLSELWMDMDKFRTWPYELNQLTSLKTLTIDDIPFVNLPDDAFGGLGTILESITFNKANFTEISPNLCKLKSLYSFTLSDTVHLNKTSSLFHPCQHVLANLTFVTIKRCQLQSFPNILTTFPSVRHIDLESNNISTFDNSLVPDVNDISTLTLNHNQLTRIPASVRKMKKIRSLELQYNNITDIGDTDISGLGNLDTLKINQNPLRYVSKKAFDGLNELDELDMSNTNMTTIPEAILSLPSLYIFPYMGNPVHCNCNMSYLKTWNISAVPFFTGFCENDALGSTLLKYIKGPLKNCP